jgi:hypothetical protein
VIPLGLRIDTDCGSPAASAQVVEIEPGKISGHRTHLCPFIDMLLAACPKLPAEGRIRLADPLPAQLGGLARVPDHSSVPPRRRSPGPSGAAAPDLAAASVTGR